MGKTARKRVGRPPGRIAPHKPVVSARVPQEVYDKITQSARKSGRTISEELVWLAHIALQIGDAQRFLLDTERATEDALRTKMRAAGMQQVRSAHGTYWKEQEDMPPLPGRLDPEFKAAITEAVREALKNEKNKPTGGDQ